MRCKDHPQSTPYLALPLLVFAFVLFLPIAAQGDIFTAASSGDLSAVRKYLAEGGEVDVKDAYNSTPLLFAARWGQLEVVDLLLAEGASPNVADNFQHESALGAAVDKGNVEIAVLLISHGAQVDDPGIFYEIVHQGQVDVLRALAENRRFYSFEIAEISRQASAKLDSNKVDDKLKTQVREIQKILAKISPETELRTVEVTPSDLARLVGNYRGRSQINVEVLTRPRGLLVREEGKEAVELVALSPLHFRSPKDPRIGISFKGRATLIEWARWSRDEENFRLSRVHQDEEVPVQQSKEETALEPIPRGAAMPWGSFRGPGGTGHGDGQGAPTKWDVTSGQNVLWSTVIPGLANSSPIVWGDRVYVTTAESEAGDRSLQSGLSGSGEGANDRSPHKWKVLALDKDTGRVVWERLAGEAKPLTDRHAKATQANSTPATDGRYVVAVFPTIGIFCYTVEGDLRWHKDLGPLNASAFLDPGIQWGFASSPILYDGKVILQADVAEGSFLTAWDLASGEEVWRLERDVIPSWTTPAIYRGERDELITNGKTIRAYDPKTGRPLWWLAPNSALVIAMPVIGPDLIYVGASYPPVRPLYAVRPGATGDLSLAEGEESSESIAWHLERGGSYMPTPILYRNRLYVGHHDGRLETYEATTGQRLYRARFSRRGTLTGSPVAADGRIYFPMEEGLIYVVRAGAAYEELAVNDMGEIVMTTPAISDGALFVRTRTHLYALGEKQSVQE